MKDLMVGRCFLKCQRCGGKHINVKINFQPDMTVFVILCYYYY